jgi:enoyl-CoA hydratase
LVAILEGKAFTPAAALANGAVDYVVPQDEVVARATELAARFGSRVKGSVATIKRSVYFGGSMSPTEGLDIESAEFFTRIPSEEAQDRMRNYLETTDATGEIPFYIPDAYAQALASGGMPGRSSTDKEASR